MRLSLLIPSALLLVACSNTPPAPVPGQDAEPPPSPSADACPAPDGPCMNADNHAQCMAIAASCEGEVLQLESCPLQFACSDGPPPAPEATPTEGAYDPCAGKQCGDTCNVCPPDDADCMETAVLKMCNAAGACEATEPTCE